MTDFCSSIWPAQLGENKAVSCVCSCGCPNGTEFLSLEAVARVQDKKPLPVSGPRITQDDLFKGSKENEMCVFC